MQLTKSSWPVRLSIYFLTLLISVAPTLPSLAKTLPIEAQNARAAEVLLEKNDFAEAVKVEQASPKPPVAQGTATEPAAQKPAGNDYLVIEPNLESEPTEAATTTEEENTAEKAKHSYTTLMRRASNTKTGKNAENKYQLALDIKDFIAEEKELLNTMGVDGQKLAAYIHRLQEQRQELDPKQKDLLESGVEKLKDALGIDKEKQKEKREDFLIPPNPASFYTVKGSGRVETLKPHYTSPNSSHVKKQSFWENPFSIARVIAGPSSLPTLPDVQADDSEIVITPEILDLAQALEQNPVNIVNYVRQNIAYQPYYGAKKGADGCLTEKICNDVDASSLLIALLRASGIPARYHKSVAVMRVEQIKNLLGVDETKTAYAALSKNGVPVYIVSNNNLDPDIDLADFSEETHLGVEWVTVEAFYTYDYRAGDFNNAVSLGTASTTQTVQAFFAPLKDKQWLPIDGLVKRHQRIKNEIVHNTAQFNTQNFWQNFLQTPSAVSPLEKYHADLLAATGKDVSNSAYQSGNQIAALDLKYLPTTLPYQIAFGTFSNGETINIEYWSKLPEHRINQIKISLLRASDKSEVLASTFAASQINNQDLELSYLGATATDRAIIDSYGGIHATPAELVNITPVLEMGAAKLTTSAPLQIGESLILQFDAIQKGQVNYTDNKFSIAGNSEGIFITFSRVQLDPVLDNQDDASRAAKVLLAGNSAVAREYLKTLQQDMDLLGATLDYNYGFTFVRGVATQNRVLSKVNGTPTTFDFKGLSLDATAGLTNYSNRGNYKNHESDFFLLFGLQGSYNEAALFTKLANLESISTVTGLQYAYQSPDYTMHTINAGNEGDLDGLNLSVGTKAAMQADVQNGHTIITPNKPVTKGSFTGILYVSYLPSGEALYAIGEQAQQNGGWSVSTLIPADWMDIDNLPHYAYEYDNGPDKFLYKEGADKHIYCTIKIQTYNEIVNGLVAPGWNLLQHGKPCMNDNESGPYQFGIHDHSFMVATNGAYFKSVSDNYDYWERMPALLEKFKDHYFNSSTIINVSNLYPYWGTFVFEEKYNVGLHEPFFATLGVYNPKTKRVYVLSQYVRQKYTSADLIDGKYAPDHLGYPLENETSSSLSVAGSIGKKQEFVNGAMFRQRTVGMLEVVAQEASGLFNYAFGKVHLVYGPWFNMFNNSNGLSSLGYPVTDVGYSSLLQTTTQKFEEKVCVSPDIQTCFTRTFLTDFASGLEEIMNTSKGVTYMASLHFSDRYLQDYNKFLKEVDSSDDTWGSKVSLCLLFNTEDVSLISALDKERFFCNFPKSLSYYQLQKEEVSQKIASIEAEQLKIYSGLRLVSDAILTNVENASYNTTEWLGYFAVDLGTMIAGPAGKIGSTTAKRIGLEVTEQFVKELASETIEKSVLHRRVRKEVESKILDLGQNPTKAQIDDIADLAVRKIIQEQGGSVLTKGRNPIKYTLTQKNTQILNDGVSNHTILETHLAPENTIISHVSEGKETLKVTIAFRGLIDDTAYHTSNSIIDQYYYAGGKKHLLNKIQVDKIIETDTITDINLGVPFQRTTWGRMINRMADTVDKKPDWSTLQIDSFGDPIGSIVELNVDVLIK